MRDRTAPRGHGLASERPIDLVLSRLDGVVQYGSGWRAFSPLQRRRRARTLSIDETDDGRVLLHDFGGAEVSEILEAIGLTTADLYPQGLASPFRHGRPWRHRLSQRDALDLLSVDAWTLVIFGRKAVEFTATHADWCAARRALNRIEELRGATR